MSALLAVTTTKPDLVVFIAVALIVLAGAFGVILSRNPVHSALMLVMTLFGIAVAFVAQGAHFLAAVQIIVYAGAIVVLFLFVIMLVGVDHPEDVRQEPLKVQRPLAFVTGLILLAELVVFGRHHWVTGAKSVVGPLTGTGRSNVALLADQLFTRYLLAFEVTSALLVIAVVGAVVLAKRAEDEIVEDDDSSSVSPEEVTA